MGLHMIRSVTIVISGLVFALAAAQAPDGPSQEELPPGTEAGEQEEGDRDKRRRRGVRRLGDVVGDGGEEWTIDIPAVQPPETAVEQLDIRLPDEAQDERLQSLLARRAFAPDDPEIEAELEALFDEVEAAALRALEAGDTELARRLIAVIAAFDVDRPVVARVEAEADRRERIRDLLARAGQALERGWLLEPEGGSALDLYRQALILEPENATARTGLDEVQQALIEAALEAARELDFEGAQFLVEAAAEVVDRPELIAETRSSITEHREHQISTLGREIDAAIEEGRFGAAEDGITQLVALGEDRDRIEGLRDRLQHERLYGGFEPGQVFSDPLADSVLDGPDMVVIPAGTFLMGSPENEDGRAGNEGPRHRVSFERGFAMGRTEVSVLEFRIFVDETGYVTDAERRGWSRIYDTNTGRIDRRPRINWRHDYLGGRATNDLPVIHVSFNDAEAYAAWLARRTGRPYRLPSEAEFEYALRGGTQTRYWWGDGSPEEAIENVTGDGDVSAVRGRWSAAFSEYTDGFWGPAPVASFPPNPFGLYDMGGNVMEWVEDCWHDSYVRAPSDGTAWVNPGCELRVLRGGAWSNSPEMCRSAFRLSDAPTGRDARVGFRVARDL